METYISSKGEKILIKDMHNSHLIHSIVKVARKITINDGEESEKEELLKALKIEAIGRLEILKEKKENGK